MLGLGALVLDTQCPGPSSKSMTPGILNCGNASITDSKSYFAQCQALLSKISSVNPQTEIDGIRNIWIIKPAAKSRGRGLPCDLQAPCLVCCGFRPPRPGPASLSLRLDAAGRLLLLLGRWAARQLEEPTTRTRMRMKTGPRRPQIMASLRKPTHRRRTLYTELFYRNCEWHHGIFCGASPSPGPAPRRPPQSLGRHS